MALDFDAALPLLHAAHTADTGDPWPNYSRSADADPHTLEIAVALRMAVDTSPGSRSLNRTLGFGTDRGANARVARELGVNPGTVRRWRAGGRTPSERDQQRLTALAVRAYLVGLPSPAQARRIREIGRSGTGAELRGDYSANVDSGQKEGHNVVRGLRIGQLVVAPVGVGYQPAMAAAVGGNWIQAAELFFPVFWRHYLGGEGTVAGIDPELVHVTRMELKR